METNGDMHAEARDAGLPVFGRVTAGTTHELNNVLSIVEQVTGLLEDQLAALESGGQLDPEKLQRVHERIGKQIRRGVLLLQQLNRFAHTVDEGRSSADLNELLEMVQVLCARFANLARCEFTVEGCAETILLQAPPFQVFEALFQLLAGLLEDAGAGERVVLRARPGEGVVTLELSCPAAQGVPGDSDRFSRARELLRAMGGDLVPPAGGAASAVQARIPATVVALDD